MAASTSSMLLKASTRAGRFAVSAATISSSRWRRWSRSKAMTPLASRCLRWDASTAALLILPMKERAALRVSPVNPPIHSVIAGTSRAASVSPSSSRKLFQSVPTRRTSASTNDLKSTNRSSSSRMPCRLLVAMSSSWSESRKSACSSPVRNLVNTPPWEMASSTSSRESLPRTSTAMRFSVSSRVAMSTLRRGLGRGRIRQACECQSRMRSTFWFIGSRNRSRRLSPLRGAQHTGRRSRQCTPCRVGALPTRCPPRTVPRSQSRDRSGEPPLAGPSRCRSR